MANKYGSKYVQLPNVSVLHNWFNIAKHIGLNNDDVLIGADPDERTQDYGWVDAMADISRKGFSVVAISMNKQQKYFKNIRDIDGYRVAVNVPTNRIIMGWSGKFMNDVLSGESISIKKLYGFTETFIMKKSKELGYDWAHLPGYIAEHTDYTNGHEGTSRLLREWKDLNVSKILTGGQISFDEFLTNYNKWQKLNI